MINTYKYIKQNEELFPESYFYEYFRESYTKLKAILAEIHDKSGVAILGTVSPKRNAEVTKKLSQDEYFSKILNLSNNHAFQVNLSNEYFRLELHRIIQNELQSISTEFGTNFIGTSSDSIDSEGFLLPEYSANDASHASKKYGDLMMHKIQHWDGAEADE